MTLQGELQELAALGVQRHYRAGSTILHEGEPGDAVYLVQSGQVRVFAQSLSGKSITYGKIEAGECFGEMSLDGGNRSASVQALSDCTCAVVPNAMVLSFAQTHPTFSTHLLQVAIGRARKATDTARDVALLDVYSRLAQTLERWPQQPIKTTHLELSALVGASREMISKLMKDLELGGYISVEKHHISLLKKLPARW